MEHHMIVSTSALIFLTLLSLHFLITKIFPRKKSNFPPGPKPWPVIGNLNLMLPLPHRSLHHLSQKYGPIMQLRIGSVPMVVGSSVEVAEIFLKTMDRNFASRPKSSAGKYTAYNCSDIVWAPYGPYLTQARKFFSMQLFSPKRLESYQYILAEERNLMLKEVFESAGNPIPLKSVLSTSKSNVLSRIVLGKKYLGGGGDESAAVVSPAEFKEMLDELISVNGAVNVGDYVPCIDFLDLQGYVRRMKAVSEKFDRFLEHVVAEHEARRRQGETAAESRDMVDLLLEMVEDPNLEVKLERNGVKALALDMFAAGSTTAEVVERAMAELLKNPKILKKATEELDRVIGQERWVKETDIPNLPYILAVLKETMRLHPFSPILLPRITREDCQVCGYDIKKGTQVIINVREIHMDPSIWENPTEFNPERFIENDIDIKGQDFRFLPFGSGRRMCPGYALALKVAESTFAHLLHGFSWKLPDNVKPDDIEINDASGLSTLRKFPLLAVADPRLPSQLYKSL